MDPRDGYQAMKEFMRRKRKEQNEEVEDSSKNVSIDTVGEKQIILKKQLHERLGLAWLKAGHVNTIKRFFIPLNQADEEGQDAEIMF